MHNTRKSNACLGAGVRVEAYSKNNQWDGVRLSRRSNESSNEESGSTGPANGEKGRHFDICPACALKQFFAYYWSDQDLDTSGNPPHDPLPIRSQNRVLDFLNIVDERFEKRQDSPEVFFYFIKELLQASTLSTADKPSPWAMMLHALTDLKLQISRSCSNTACPRNASPQLSEADDQPGIMALSIDETADDRLEASLHRHLVDQELSSYRCDCGQIDTNTETRSILAAPDILRIHLAPGSYGQDEHGSKIATKFDIPEHLDLTRYQVDQSTPLKYRLSSVINHLGGVRRGHYIATVRGPGDVYVINDHEMHTCGASHQEPEHKSRLLCRNQQKWPKFSDEYQAFILTYVREPNRELEKLQ